MPYWLAAIGAILSCFERYWTFQAMVLYGCVGYLIGSVFKLREAQTALRADYDTLFDRLRKMGTEPAGSSPEKTSSPEKATPTRRESEFTTAKTPAPLPPLWEPSAPVPPTAPSKHSMPSETQGADQPFVRSTPSEPQATKSSGPKPIVFHPPENEGPFIPSFITDFFTKGNVFAKVGGILLFFGVSFLIKLVAEMGFFPLEVRVLACGVISFVLIGLGFRLALERRA